MFSDFKPLFKKFKKYRVESVLIILSILVTFISLFIFLLSSNVTNQEIIIEEDNKNKVSNTIQSLNNKFIVDVSGAVVAPGVYELESGSRINDAIKIAGGLSNEADSSYFYRNFNLSAFVYDQEKIYIPYSWEITTGIFIENTRILNYLSMIPSIENVETVKANDKIDINSATIDELDELTGIGVVTAQKIIQNRPYSTINQLSEKKIVNKSVFENIKDDIVAN
ncbi:MAG: helix-hairpin-helix domain-containing protein [Patescibacteria group bacterium]